MRIIHDTKRPMITDYINELFTDFTELHGDRYFSDDHAILGGVGYFNGTPVTVIGHRKGRTIEQNMDANFGMAHPEGYRKALRLAHQAEKFHRPVINFVDTGGAFCGVGAEERGQGEAIARNLFEMSRLTVPVIAVITGEGNSGGALLNGKGEVIGMNTVKYSDTSVEGMGYAIPISKAKPILEELMNRETREKVDSSKKGYLGVSLASLTTEAIEMYNMPTGAFVRSVEDDSPAQEAGICKGDIIVKFDGQKVSDGDDLLDKLQYYKSGEKIEAVIARATNGEYEENTIELTLGTRPDNE